MKKIFTFIACVSLISFFVIGCKKVKPEFENHREVYKESQLYLGIAGFNDQLDFCKVANKHFVPVESEDKLKSFVAGLSLRNGTVLYYAVDSALNWLESVEFPTDLTNVSLVTFTDGLDQGSTALNPTYNSRSDYLDAMSYRIRNEKIGKSIPINAYSIGVKGSDVMDEIQFKANLTKLASNILNVYEVTDMNAVNINFKRIARQIRASITPDMSVQIVAPDNNTKIRFTFDDVKTASLSTCYIEGVYSDGILTDIKTVGCTCDEAGIKTTTNGIHRTIIFPDLKAILGTLKTTNIRQWDWSSNIGGWQINSEFNPQTELKYRKTSVIMLVLDCSSSLGSNFPLMKNSVNEFISILSGSWSDYSVPPLVQTTEVNITNSTATVAGMISDDGDASVTERGVCWGTNENPTISNSKTTAGTGMGSFSASITGLKGSTTYYVRAYAINSAGTSYGDQKTFTTQTPKEPTVVTSAAKAIEYTRVTIGGNITDDGGATITEYGVCWSTSASPTISNNKKKFIGWVTDDFSTSITGLKAGTTYYVRAYAINSAGISYGDQKTFTTLGNINNGIEYVDLGLSVKWATCNIGASKPEEFGDYYAWGETSTKSTYDWSTYKYCNGSSVTQTKYCTISYFGKVDNKTTLEKSDDVAYTTLGGSWRMPTDAEWTELRNQCEWTWKSKNGVNGYEVKASNGNSIFLPAAGRIESNLNYAGSDGFYWSSSLREDGSDGAWYMYFYSGNVRVSLYDRYDGLSVRPVLAE
ncbi:MAG: hypothetical protein MJ198_07085 [Bacteroidales bacterium]|nr:hypothetical protein [Bacteroidales bacterium]